MGTGPWWTRLGIMWGATLLTLMVTPGTMPAQRSVFTVPMDSLSGSPAAIRTGVHRRLLEDGFSVREIAACDCLITAEPRLIGGEPTELRIHILRPPNGIVVRVVIQALIGPPNTPTTGGRSEVSRELRDLLNRLREDIDRARIPALSRPR